MMLTAWIKSPIPYAGCKFDMLDELEAIIGSGETLVILAFYVLVGTLEAV